jgi:hypothetical protein
MDASVVAEVQRASDLTMEVGTARVSCAAVFRAGAFGRVVDILAASKTDPPLSKTASRAWSLVGRGIKLAEKASDGKTTRSEGVADFRSGGCVTVRVMLGRQFETYFLPGRLLERRRGGRWREKSMVRFEGSYQYSPMWLVELPRGAMEATVLNEEPVDGAPCRHIGGVADPQQAATRSVHGMSEGVVARRGSGHTVPLEVWIDSSGWLRRVRTAIEITDPDHPSQDSTCWSYEVTLGDLGTAPAPPAADEPEPVGARWPQVDVAEALISAWAPRIREVLPAGATVEYNGGVHYSIRVTGASSGVSSSQTPMLELMLPGTAAQKLERAYRKQAETLQDVISKGLKVQWPAPGAKPHVEVGSEKIEIWWATPATPQATLRIRPIPRAELGI